MLKFFKIEDENRIIGAIRAAEERTSGEIRVHLEDKCKGNILEEAQRAFLKLKMNETAQRNGVLIFIAPSRKEFAIVGDKGINEVVPENFWEAERDLMQQHFRNEQFAEGIALALHQIGMKLREFFPIQEDDENELPDEISYG
ncbi:MAG: TPM domain-containing protein [Bacteroidota bacterium]